MLRRVCSFCVVFLLLVSVSHVLIAQVFPDREELDVVRLIDGTVLKGVILEQMPDRYLEIQLYGGSTFVLGYEQIEAVEQEANPDYGTTWIKVDLYALEAEAEQTEAADSTAQDAELRPLSAGGHLVSAYSFGWLTTSLSPPIDVGGPTGNEWDDTLSDRNIDDRISPDDDYSFPGNRSLGVGVTYTWWTPFAETDSPSWMWGIRGSVGFHMLAESFKVEKENEVPEQENTEIQTETTQLPVITEGLIGISGDRAALLAGIGIGGGVSIHSTVKLYSDGNRDEKEIGTAQAFSPMYSASLSGLFRLGRRWVTEVGLWANGDFESPFDEGIIFRSWGERIAIGYRFGGK